MAQSWRALEGDGDARTILAALRTLPPGRTHAGLRANWGNAFRVADVPFYALLMFHRVVAVSPPFQSLSLNADFVWHFDDHNPAHYALFDVKYLVAPRGWPAPAFVQPIRETARYLLYEAPTSGYTQFAAVTERAAPPSQAELFRRNLTWFQSGEPAAGRFIRHDFPPGRRAERERTAAAGSGPDTQTRCPAGRTTEERVRPGQVAVVAECPAPSTLVFKFSYHPNWRVTVDGVEAPSFMVSPSFIGVSLPAGRHEVRAEYRPAPYRMALLILGVTTLVTVIGGRRRLESLEARITRR
jgi:hypothetical protein